MIDEVSKQQRQIASERYFKKLDEVFAFGKAHSPEEKNGQEYKSKMEQHRQELHKLAQERMLLMNH